MCVDLIDLNKTCPKDSYPLLNINSVANVALGYNILSLYNAFFRYSWILMWEENHPKITFIMDDSIFCYKVMPFGLKNVRAIYQRMINNVFKDQIKRNQKVYVDDIMIKSKNLDYHIDLEENFIMMNDEI